MNARVCVRDWKSKLVWDFKFNLRKTTISWAKQYKLIGRKTKWYKEK